MSTPVSCLCRHEDWLLQDLVKVRYGTQVDISDFMSVGKTQV